MHLSGLIFALVVVVASPILACGGSQCCKHGTVTATATEFKCTCSAGWSGADCSIERSSCENGGVQKCVCPPTYSGDRCERRTCSVELKATGYDDKDLDDKNAGHIAVNGVKFFNSVKGVDFKRGVNLVLLNKVTCTGYNYQNFDTHGDAGAANRLVKYLNEVPVGTIVLGVSNDSASEKLSPALPTLKSFGVNVDSLKTRDKFLFVTEKGSQTIKAQLERASTPSIVYTANF